MPIRRFYVTSVLIAFAVVALCLGAQQKDEAAAPAIRITPPHQFKNILYGRQSGPENGSSAQMLDVYENAGATPQSPAPVLVYFHGGGWYKGNRPATYGPFKTFLKMGFSVVSVDYRLTGVATAPAAVQDARCVLSWVKANAAQYNFDVTRIVPYGTSAGGHLALMAGMLPIPSDIDSPACKDVPRAAAILNFYGPADLRPDEEGAFKLPLLAKWIGPQKDVAAYESLMSPITYVRPGLPPVFIAHGDADPLVPHEGSVRLQAALQAAGVPTDFYSVPGGVHGRFPPDQMLIIYDRVQAFLRQVKVLPPR